MPGISVDQCLHCEVPDRTDEDFTCSDCPCYCCADIHSCTGQCGEDKEDNDA